MSSQPWWQLVDDWINPKIQKVSDVRQNIIDAAGGNDSIGGAIAGGVTLPAQGLVDIVSGLGRGIGGVAGAAGGYLSEAGQEAAAREDSRGELDAILSGIKGGSEAGAEASRENIGLLDIASMGAGALGGAASKAAKVAAMSDDLARAGSLARGASTLQKADLGLGAADAALGAGQMKTAYDEGDWAGGAMGLARVAGNAAGMHGSMKDLGEGHALRSVIDELGLKDTKALDVAAAGKPTGKPEIGGKFDANLRHDGTAPEDVIDQARMGTGGTPSTMMDMGRKYPAMRNQELKHRSGISEFTSTVDQFESRAGETFTIEATTPMKTGHKWQPEFPSETLAKAVAAHPETVEALGDYVTWLRQVGEEAVDTLTPRISTAQDMMVTGGTQPLRQYVGAKKIRGLDYGSKSQGSSYPNATNLNPTDAKGAANAAWNNAALVNPHEIAKHADFLMESLVTGTMDEKLLAKALEPLSDDAKAYIMGIRAGESRMPQLEELFKAEQFMRDSMYVAAHEVVTHARPDSSHVAPVETYHRSIYTKEGKLAAADAKQRSLDDVIKGQGSMFDPANNVLVSAIADPTQLPIGKRLLTDRERMLQFYRAAKGEKALEAWRTTPKKAGRTVDLKAKKAAAMEFAGEEQVPIATGTAWRKDPDAIMEQYKAGHIDADTVHDLMLKPLWERGGVTLNEASAQIRKMIEKADGEIGVGSLMDRTEARAKAGEQPPTPPGSVPPGSPPEPFGPNLQPLAQRIKNTLTENRKVNALNNQKKSEIRNLKAQALQEIDDKLQSGQLTHAEAMVEQSKVMSGEFGLEKTIAQLPITEIEKQMMTERLAQVIQEDRFVRANNRASWDKMLKGERLTDGEVKSITDALNLKIADAGETPLIRKLLESAQNFVGGSRALMSSYDLSAAGRQALFASVMNPREAARAFKAQVDALRMTPKEFAAFMDTFDDPNLNPMRDLQKASGLHISHQKGVDTQEEAFLRASWAEKIPGVLRSEQAYIAYLNKMRVELFNKGAKQLMDSGAALQDADGIFNPIFQDLAYMVNTLTGRGEMSAVHISAKSGQGKLMGLNATFAPGEEAMKNMHSALTNVFFAPRFAASRAAILRDATLGLVGGNLEAPVYKMYMKNVYGTIGVMSSLAAAVAATGAGTFNVDPSKKDFGVLRVGKVRYDLYGGLKPWAKLGLSLTEDTYPDSKNRQKKYGSFGGKTHTGDIGRFVQGKLSPPASLLMEAITGEDFMGNKSTAFNKAYSHFTPMILQTITEAIAEGEAEQLPLAVPAAVLGIGVNTYGDRRNR